MDYTFKVHNLASKYSDNEILTKDSFIFIDYFFPYVEYKKLKLLQINKEGIYSTNHPSLMRQIIYIIEKQLNTSIKNLVITDATANIGGSAINFAINAKFTNAIEINPITYSILENNVNVYDLKKMGKIKTYCNDYVSIMDNLIQNVIFIDPPWGGLNYKKFKKIDLYLSQIPIAYIINRLRNKANLILIKVPVNFSYELFSKHLSGLRSADSCKFALIKYYKIRNFFIISILLRCMEN